MVKYLFVLRAWSTFLGNRSTPMHRIKNSLGATYENNEVSPVLPNWPTSVGPRSTVTGQSVFIFVVFFVHQVLLLRKCQ